MFTFSSISNLINQIHSISPLLRIKIFDFKSIKWFLLSIIAISTLFTVSSSFLLGFQNQQLFTANSANDVLVISQPKITPAESLIPLFWINDIQQLPGIKVVSPETVDIVIDQTNGQTPYFRGVTDNFRNITSSFTILTGHYFDTTPNSTKNEIIVGENYAKLFNVHVGDNLVLQSRPKTAFIDVTVVGIFQTHTIDDDGLLGPLWMGRLFGGIPSDKVNIIRIKFDTSMYTKSDLQNIILSNHELQIKVTNPYKYNLAISRTQVVLFNRYKQQINQSFVNSLNEANFVVPFGKYYVELKNPAVPDSSFTSIFIKSNSNIKLILGTQYASFSAQFFISNEVKDNAIINVVNSDTDNQFNFTTNNNGMIQANLPLGTLKISYTWKGYKNSTIIDHQTNQTLKINFDYKIHFNLRSSATNTTLQNKQVVITNLQNNNKIIAYSGQDGVVSASLQPSTPYSIISTNSAYYRNYTLSEFNNTSVNLFLGEITVKVQVLNVNVGALSNYPVKLSLTDPSTLRTNTSNQITDSNGFIEFQSMAGISVSLLAIYGSQNNTYNKKFIIQNIGYYEFYLGKQEFFITMTNVSADLLPINLVINDLNSSFTTNLILTSTASFKLFLYYDNYSFSGSSTQNSFYTEINFNSSSNNIFEINFQNYKVDLKFFSKNGTSFTGNFELLQKNQGGFSKIQNYQTSRIQTSLHNGLYEILLKDPGYVFDRILLINNQIQTHSFIVSEDLPVINPLNFANFTICNSSLILFLGAQNSKLVQYEWNGNQFENYNPLSGIIPPTSQGLSKLTILAKNFDNISIKFIYMITIDNTGPIATLLNVQRNNSLINFNFLPKFSFSKTPKFVFYEWNNASKSSSPTTIPNVQGLQNLTVEVSDYAGNINTFRYQFTFDNQTPEIISSNPDNKTAIYNITQIFLNFSETVKNIQYEWNGGFFLALSGTHQIPVPRIDGTNFNLTISFVDLAGNKNQEILFFPIVNQNLPVFDLITPEYTTFNQINDSRIFFKILNNGNTTLMYQWISLSKQSFMHIQNNQTNYITFPNVNNTNELNGTLELNITIFDQFGYNFTHIFYFIGKISDPQFNVSITLPIEPNEPIKIIFPSTYSNWTINWDNGNNISGDNTTGFSIISAPTSLGNHTLNLQISFTNSTIISLSYNVTIANAQPSISNDNSTYLSGLLAYNLTFPSYTISWSYHWNSLGSFSGSNLTTILIIPLNLTGKDTLFLNYTTSYGISYIELNYTLDSVSPQAYLVNASNGSHQRAGFSPQINFTEYLQKVLYAWDGQLNVTYILPMPNGTDNTLENLTIYMEDMANNWNVTIFTFVEDNTPISIQLSPDNGTVNNNYVQQGNIIIFKITEIPNSINCYWNGVSYGNCSTFVNSTDIFVPVRSFQGSIQFSIWIYDSAGNGNVYTLVLDSYKNLPVLTYSTLQNNSIINSYFIFTYKFSESISSANSIYAWDSFGNTTGFPVINNTLIGEHILNWWFSDSSGNWNHYLFIVLIDTHLPSFTIIGNYSSNVIIANSTIKINPVDNSDKMDVYISWNQTELSYFENPSNIAITLPLPNWLGNTSLQIALKDMYGNWFNESYSFMIEPFLNIEVKDTNNNPISNTSLILINEQSNEIILNAQTSQISQLVNPGNYKLIIVFQNYNLSSNLNLQISSFSETVFLRKLLIQYINNQSTTTLGTVQWNDGSLFSTNLQVKGSSSIYAPVSSTSFKATFDNKTMQRTLDISKNINAVNFTNQLVVLSLKIISPQNKLPISNAIIKSDNKVIGQSDSNGTFTQKITPGSHFIVVYYSIFKANLSIQIFENQFYEVELPVYSNITVAIHNQDSSPAEGIQVSLYSASNKFIDSELTNFNGIINWNFLPWGAYYIQIHTNSSISNYPINISSSTEQNTNIFTFSLPATDQLLSQVGNNLGKWTFNRNYELVAPSELSDTTLQNLGFSIIFPTLFLIILLMTILGVMSVIHQPIFKLKNTIRDLQRLGATKEQILVIISVQISVLGFVLSLIGYVIGFILILFWPSLQQFPIAGMVIRPEINNILLPIFIGVSFSLITAVFTFYHTKKEYFTKVKKIN